MILEWIYSNPDLLLDLWNQVEDTIEALLADLKSIMIKHLSGNYNENLCYAVIFAISSLEKDIKQHNRIRFRILTPMVAAMEKLCS